MPHLPIVPPSETPNFVLIPSHLAATRMTPLARACLDAFDSPDALSNHAPEQATLAMHALVYLGPGERALQEKPKPRIQAPTDAVVRVVATTICGTDLHILKGDVPTVAPGDAPLRP